MLKSLLLVVLKFLAEKRVVVGLPSKKGLEIPGLVFWLVCRFHTLSGLFTTPLISARLDLVLTFSKFL